MYRSKEIGDKYIYLSHCMSEVSTLSYIIAVNSQSILLGWEGDPNPTEWTERVRVGLDVAIGISIIA